MNTAKKFRIDADMNYDSYITTSFPMHALSRTTAALTALVCYFPAMITTAAPDYAADLAFLSGHTEIIELRSGESRVALAPAWQGRVMTSTPGGENARAMGFIHRPVIESGILPEASRTGLQKHIHVFGGEERLWFGPEGGPYSLFFPPGVPQEFAHWKTPALIDTEPFAVESRTETKVVFTKSAALTNRAGATLEMDIRRVVEVLDPVAIGELLHTPLGEGIRPVAYRSTNTVTNRGARAWTKETGLPSIWMLGMFPPTPGTTIVIPLRTGSDAEPNTNYTGFGPIPGERAKVAGNHLFFKGDGESRGKLGVPPARAMPFSGAWQADAGVLTLLHTPLPANVADLPHVDSQWKEEGDPYAGDVINSYNDGPPEPGAKPLGPFWELETSSPALALTPGAAHSHLQTTLHLTGPRAALDAIARAVLGVSLDEVETALP
jgi:hypothetical protein